MGRANKKDQTVGESLGPLGWDHNLDTVPVSYEELSSHEKGLFVSRMAHFDKTSFTLLDLDDIYSLDFGDIPPLTGSIYSAACMGTGCPYVFMSEGEDLVSLAMKIPAYSREATVRVQEFEDGTRLYFVGFRDSIQATFFAWEFVYDPDILDKVYYNGHKVLCGEELLTSRNLV